MPTYNASALFEKNLTPKQPMENTCNW